MTSPASPRDSSLLSTLRRDFSQGPLSLLLTAFFGLSLAGACGKDEKKTNPPTGSGGGGNIDTDPDLDGTGGGTGDANTIHSSDPTMPSPTDTKIDMVTELNQPTKSAIYAVLSEDNKKIGIYAYDQCAYIKSSHDPAGTSASSDAYGDGLYLDISPTGINATTGLKYTVTPQTASSDGSTMYDKFVVGTYKFMPSGNNCDLTTRPAKTGTVTFSSVDGSQVSGTIDVKVVSYEPSVQATLKGSFVAKKCGLPTVAPAKTYQNETDACHDSADQTARKTSGGIHYK